VKKKQAVNPGFNPKTWKTWGGALLYYFVEEFWFNGFRISVKFGH